MTTYIVLFHLVGWAGFSFTGGMLAVNVLALAGLLCLVIAIAPLCRQDSDSRSGLVCGLVAAAPFVPLSVAGVVTVAIYTLPIKGAAWGRPHHVALLIGSLLGLIVWLFWAIVSRTRATARIENSQEYSELHRRCDAAEAWYAGIDNPVKLSNFELDAWTTVRQNLDTVERELGVKGRNGGDEDPELPSAPRGLRWVLATGYISLWRRIHAVEQSLLLVQPLPAALGEGHRDELRLQGSGIPQSDALLGRLRRALELLQPQHSQDDQDQPQQTDSSSVVSSQTTGRTLLKEVRTAIDEFRDGLREGLVRQRNHIIESIIFIEVAGFLFLGMLILIGVPRHSVLAAAAYCLGGGVVGMLVRLRSVYRLPVEDYGLGSASLLQAWLLSGLVGLAGVLLIALIFDPLGTSGLLPYSKPGTMPNLNQIFGLKNNSAGIVLSGIVALIFEAVVAWFYRGGNVLRRQMLDTRPSDGAE